MPSVRARTFGVSEEEKEEEEGGLCEYEGGDWRGGWRRSEDEYKVTMLGNESSWETRRERQGRMPRKHWRKTEGGKGR